MNDDFQLRLAAAFPAHADAELIRGLERAFCLQMGFSIVSRSFRI